MSPAPPPFSAKKHLTQRHGPRTFEYEVTAPKGWCFDPHDDSTGGLHALVTSSHRAGTSAKEVREEAVRDALDYWPHLSPCPDDCEFWEEVKS